MTQGPGKYDDEATFAREESGAAAVVLVVLGGYKGSGFSIQAKAKFLLAKMPALLRAVAAEIERDLEIEKLG